MCTRFVYNGIDKIVGFNFDIDLSVWDHTVITEENRFYIGIKMPDGMYHSFHGINKNGNVGTLLYVHGNENARYIESEDCITISELTEKFIKAEISFDKALDIVKKKKIIYAPDATMQAMLSDKKGRVLIIEPGIGYRYEQENFSLITNYSILKPDITKPYIVSGDTRYEVAKELLAGYDKDFSVNDAFKVLKSVSQKDLWATRVSFVYSTEKNKVYYVLNNDFSNVYNMIPKGIPFMIFCSNTLAAVSVWISSCTCILSRMIPAVWLIISVSSPPLRFAAANTWAN